MPLDDYDDDEKNEPVGFEQDPESDDIGDGYWTYADGSRKYSSDYDKAMELNAQGKAKGIDTIAGQAPEPEPLSGAPDVLPEEPLAKQPEEEAEPAQPVPAPQPLMAPPAPSRPLPLSGQSRQTQMQQNQSETAQRGSSSNVQRTSSAMSAEQHEQGQGDVRAAYDNAIQTAEDNRFAEAAALAARAGQMQQAGRDREIQASAAIEQNKARQVASVAKIKEVGSRKVDNNRVWKDKGVLGTLAGAIGVFLGGISAYTTGRENTALKAIQEQKQQAIDSQLEDRNSELRSLERELGSLEAAVPVYEARMNDALKQQVEASLVDERSATALRNGRTLIAQLEAEKVANLGDAAKAYYGTITQQQAQSQQLASTAGSQASVAEGETRAPVKTGAGLSALDARKKAYEIDKIVEERGGTPEERAELYKMAGVPMPTGKTAPQIAQGKQSDAEKKRTNITNSLTAMHKQLDDLPDEVFTPDTSNAAVRAGRAVTDFWLGDGTADKAFLSPEERKQSQQFTQAYNSYLSMLSVANEQGAMAGEEAKRAIEAAGAINSPRLLQSAVENALELIRAKAALDEEPQQSGATPPSAWKGGAQ